MTIGPDACHTEGDNVQIFRAIQNIVGNAVDALPDTDGLVSITWQADDTKVQVVVEDDGNGFPPEKLEDMQTKYYTTKAETGGMGLGLFITKNIMEAHGGSLVLSNRPDRSGARVVLAFPRV